ncbi:Bifunctional purine biosynthetic protein ADE1 [Vermiconidia calcicola]|uniref:Bifunctional purine biosynthetic protein ADE1 n=1 Tax=Vermiconidia calcicola TaxID=1690605 RepID=A0ACC3NKM5_9PEZI|nr:Bifunctional purine biosynthetic protein ADE1 [Vermiconidia calcicola]
MASSRLRVLLIGNGGREHTLAWKLAQSTRVESIHVVPGNGGTAGLEKCTNVTSVSAEDFPALVKYAKDHNLNFCIPGPEAPLVAGIVDHFQQNAPEVQCFGPSQAAARMEGSKTFSKDFMKRNSIPTARYENFDDYESAKQHLDSIDYSVVIKADGLAAGKGVIIPTSKNEAQAALKEIMLDKEFGSAGNSVVIEEYLEGDEISILSLSDGKTILSLPPAQDHKRIGDNDTGPNTGGMGTYAPTPLTTKDLLSEIERTILQPTIDGMSKEGFPFCGCLFTGLMLTKAGPRVLEYNVRFGDPESQSCLPLLQSDLADLMQACCKGSLASQSLSIAPLSACTVVVAAGGYPGSYAKGTVMEVNEPTQDGMYLFHAGTNLGSDGVLKTSGGRVIAATATGATLREAVDRAYEGVRMISFEGMQYRKDIAYRALR